MNARADRISLAAYAIHPHAQASFEKRTGATRAAMRRDMARARQAGRARFVDQCGEWAATGDEEYWEGGYGFYVAKPPMVVGFARRRNAPLTAPVGSLAAVKVDDPAKVGRLYLADWARKLKVRASNAEREADIHLRRAGEAPWYRPGVRRRENEEVRYYLGRASGLRIAAACLEAEARKGGRDADAR